MDNSLTEGFSEIDSGKIKSIKSKPLGHINSIYFWSKEQKQIQKLLGLVLFSLLFKM